VVLIKPLGSLSWLLGTAQRTEKAHLPLPTTWDWTGSYSCLQESAS